MSIELPGWVVDGFFLVGLPWPGVDEDELRGWGRDLREFATEIGEISQLSRDAVAGLKDTNESAFVKTISAQWDHHHREILAMREPMRVFADALDVAAEAVEVQKGLVITAATTLALAIIATQGEALFTFGLAEAEIPAEVAIAKMAIKMAVQELEMKLLTVLIDHASKEVSDHAGKAIANLLKGGVGVAFEAVSLKADYQGLRRVAATAKTHARRAETSSMRSHRRATNRKLETHSPGGRWHVAQVLEAALKEIAEDLLRKLPSTLHTILLDTEKDLTKAADTIERADAKVAEDAKNTPRADEGAPPAADPGAGGVIPPIKPPGRPTGPPEEPGEGDPGGRKPGRKKLPPKDTPEGKAARWERYEARTQTEAYKALVAAGKRRRPLGYDAWSNVYDVNIHQHARAADAVDDYAQRHGLTADNGYVQEHPVPMGNGKERRLDIAHPERAEGIEYKSGAVPNDEKLAAEIKHDGMLINRGWNIKWVFKLAPTQDLKDRLKAAGIPWEMDDGTTPPKPQSGASGGPVPPANAPDAQQDDQPDDASGTQ